MGKISKQGTGKRLRKLLADRGITVRMVQERMGLESPQAVYKWLNGKALPSTENLFVLSRILGLPIEELLVQEEKAREKVAGDGKKNCGEQAQAGAGKEKDEIRCHVSCEIPSRDLIRVAKRFQEEIGRTLEKGRGRDQSSKSS